jgi:phosphoadenosine phosphosulfate reductase
MRTRTTTSSRYRCLSFPLSPRLSLPQVEPASRAYNEHNVRAVITGRRASQGADRASLQPLEVDSTGMLKLNPFFAWSFAQVKAYIDEHNVPRNALLSKGYRSVGDWHSTQPVSADGDASERAGRWAGKAKTECGLHNKDFSKVRLAAKKKVRYLFFDLYQTILIWFLAT